MSFIGSSFSFGLALPLKKFGKAWERRHLAGKDRAAI
jgi:hypothetical protein